MNFVTFIIPTLDRPTLKRTLNSLIQQTDPDWIAYVLGDGCKITEYIQDKRIFYIPLDKQDGGAGIVRNIGLSLVESEWTAFVDDDDYLKNNYIQCIKNFAKNYDLIQFSYKDVENGNVQPPDNLDHLVECNFGISFAIRTSFMNAHTIRFTKGGVEDYRFLKDATDAGARYIITHLKIYFVGHRSAWSNN